MGDYPSTRLAPYRRGRFGDGKLVGEDMYRYLIEMFLPPTVIIDEQRQLLHAFGNVDQFLQVPSGGRVSLDLLKMVREGLSIPLSTAIHKVLKDDQEDILYKNVALSEKLVSSSGEEETEVTWIDIFVKPLRDPVTKQKQILVQFRKAQTQEELSKHVETFDADVNALQRIADLEQELQFTRESLQATVEELETSNEELQATNEELLAANEELQSTNEELQSVNEELVTVNAEYQAKIQELMDLNADLNNLFSSTDVGTIFLDRFLRIRRFTPAVQHEIHLLEQDIGRPLAHISHNFVGIDLAYEAQSVIKSLSVREIEVQSVQKRWYLIKFHPYYTLDRRPDGVVISLVDITDLKASDEQAMMLSAALEQSPLLKLLIKLDGKIMYINPRVREITSYVPKEVLGCHGRIFAQPVEGESG
jgi:two-component system CheB/CheR fusion protein